MVWPGHRPVLGIIQGLPLSAPGPPTGLIRPCLHLYINIPYIITQCTSRSQSVRTIEFHNSVLTIEAHIEAHNRGSQFRLTIEAHNRGS